MAKRRTTVGGDAGRYLPIRRPTPLHSSGPARSCFSSDSEDDGNPFIAHRQQDRRRRQTIASVNALESSSDSNSESQDENKNVQSDAVARMSSQGRDPFCDDVATSAATRTFNSLEATSRRRLSRGGSAANSESDGHSGKHRDSFPDDYKFPPRQTYQALPSSAPSASTSAATLTDLPRRPPGLELRDLDEEIEMRASASESQITEDRGRGEHDGDCDKGDVGVNGVGERKKPQKMTVTMKSPTVADFKEFSPMAPSFPIHTRDDSEPTSGMRSGYSTPGGSEGEPSDDDYDWSGEEDLAEQQAKFSDQLGIKKKGENSIIKRVIKFLFTTLIGSTLLSAIIIAPPLVVHFVWYKPNPTEHRGYVDKNVQAWLFWVAANITISWFLALIVDVIPLFVQYFLVATWGHVSEAIKSRLEMYNAVKDTVKPAFYGASGIASWVIIFDHIYQLHSTDDDVTSAAPYTERVYQVVLFFFFFFLIVCIQKMLSHVIAWNFHQTAYSDRMEEVQRSLIVIEKLQKYRPKHYKRPHGTQTPMSSFGFGKAMSEKEHARKLDNALRSALKNPSRLPNHMEPDEDAGDPSRKRMSYSFFTPTPGPSNLVTPAEEFKDPFANVKPSGRGSGTGQDIEEIPLETVHFSDRVKLSAPTPPRLALQKNQFEPHHRHTPSAASYPESARGTPLFDRGPQRPHMPRRTTDAEQAIKTAAKVVGKAVLHDARNLQGKQVDLLSWDVSSSQEAKRLAKSIFRRLRDKHRKYLVASDFYPAFSTVQEAESAFRLFDKDSNGDLSRGELKVKLVKTYQERRFLSRSLKDVGAALKTLDRILLILACIIVAFVSLSVFGVEVGSSLTSMYSIGIAASFIFKSSASRAFDAIMFLFVTHPYDTGDRVFIGTENLVVKKVGLFATVFQRSDGTETYYFNSQLFAEFITNARRSDKTTENMTMEISWKTPLERLDALEKALNDWLATEENRWYRPGTGVTLQHIVYQRYLTLTIGIPHNGNWQDWNMRNARRTAFQAAVQYYCRQLGITGYEAPLPIVFQDAEATLIADSPALAKDGECDLDTHLPPSPSIAPPSPFSPPEEFHSLQEDRATAEGGAKKTSTLGFRPPESAKHLARARKSHRSRKENLGAANA